MNKFIFALDLIGAIATFAQVLQVMGQGGTGIEYLLVTSIVELIACISCLVFAFLDERKIKTNSLDISKTSNKITAIFFGAITIAFIAVLASVGIAVAGIIALIILFILLIAFNLFMLFVDKVNLTDSVKNILRIVADGINFIFSIVLLVSFLSASVIGIIAGIFLLIFYMLVIAIDVMVGFFPKALEIILTKKQNNSNENNNIKEVETDNEEGTTKEENNNEPDSDK